MNLRTNLKIFRVKHRLSQEEMAKKLGYSRATYAAIESGKRAGKQVFWIDFQEAFNVPDEELWGYMKNEED